MTRNKESEVEDAISDINDTLIYDLKKDCKLIRATVFNYSEREEFSIENEKELSFEEFKKNVHDKIYDVFGTYCGDENLSNSDFIEAEEEKTILYIGSKDNYNFLYEKEEYIVKWSYDEYENPAADMHNRV